MTAVPELVRVAAAAGLKARQCGRVAGRRSTVAAALELAGGEASQSTLELCAASDGSDPLLGGAQGRDWALELQLTRAAAVGESNRLGDLSDRLALVEEKVFERVLGAADVALASALRRAGARVVSKVKTAGARKAMQEARYDEKLAVLPPAVQANLTADEDQLLQDAFLELEDRLGDTFAGAINEAITEVALATGVDPSQLRRIYEERTQERSAAAVAVLAGGLLALARTRLTNPNPDAPPIGEFDVKSNVPAAIVKDALAAAGGADVIGSELVRTPTGRTVYNGQANRAAGNLAFGPDLLTSLEGVAGPLTEPVRFRWVWGGASVPFEPHVALNGKLYTEAEAAAVLRADPGVFPYVSEFYPQDHRGCTCTEVITFELFEDREFVLPDAA